LCRAWDHYDLRRKLVDRIYPRYHSSLDSLGTEESFSGSAESQGDPEESSATGVQDAQDCFTAQCNQIFIGMITMQYQAKQVTG